MYRVYEIKSDDTLEKIAMKYFIDCDEICRLNGIVEVVPGSFIVLPNDGDMYNLYNVKPGDTLYSISQKYNIDLNSLYSINGLDDGDYIYPNQEILIPKDDFSVYVSHDSESIMEISDKLGISVSDIISYNPNLLLESDQLIFFK